MSTVTLCHCWWGHLVIVWYKMSCFFVEICFCFACLLYQRIDFMNLFCSYWWNLLYFPSFSFFTVGMGFDFWLMGVQKAVILWSVYIYSDKACMIFIYNMISLIILHQIICITSLGKFLRFPDKYFIWVV